MTAKIASIYFAPVSAERPLYGGHYEMPPVPLNGKPFILEVMDREQRWEGPYSLGQGGKRSKHRETIQGQVIAADLVAHWSQNGLFMYPDCHPGVWLVRDRVPDLNEDGTLRVDADGRQLFKPATAEEATAFWEEDLAHARRADQAYAKALYEDANTLANDPRGSRAQFIQRPARLGAQQYGYEAEWVSGAPIPMKTCQFCAKTVPHRVIVCPFCREVVDATAYAVEQARREAETKAARQAVKAA